MLSMNFCCSALIEEIGNNLKFELRYDSDSNPPLIFYEIALNQPHRLSGVCNPIKHCPFCGTELIFPKESMEG